MHAKSVIVTVFIGLLSLDIGMMLSQIVESHWPILATSLLVVISLVVLLLWSRITKPIISKIKNNLTVTILRITIDDTRQDVRVNLNIANNQRHKLRLRPLIGGIANLDATEVSRDIKPIEYTPDLVLEGRKLDNFVQVRFSLLSTYMNKFREKAKGRREANWKFDFMWEVDSFWGTTFLALNDVPFKGIPEIGNIT